MTRFTRLVAPLSVAAAILFLGDWATAQAPQKDKPATKPKVRRSTVHYAVPGFPGLHSESAQKEIELLDEQKEKIKAIVQEYYGEMRHMGGKLRGLSKEERRAKYTERREAVTKKIEAILLPHQVARLKELNFRKRGSSAMSNPRIIDQLGLSSEQEKKLQKLRLEMNDKVAKLRQEMLDKALEVLTAEQREKFKELGTKPFFSRMPVMPVRKK